MEAVAKEDYVSVFEYYEQERVSEEKCDYFDGRVYSMAGGSAKHSILKVNLITSLSNQLKGKPCGVYDSDLRVKSKESSLRIYPDASIFCGPLEYDEEDSQRHTAVNPSALFEVLSDSTELYDRGFKFARFRHVPSMKAFVLISQNYAGVEVFERNEKGVWELHEAIGRESSIEIPSLGIVLNLAELYDRIEDDNLAPEPVETKVE